MLAAPILNPITAYSTFKAFENSFFMTGSRLGLGYLVAIIVALVMSRVAYSRYLKNIEESHSHAHNHPRTLHAALMNSLRDLVDVGLYFCIGVLLTALLKTMVIDPTSEFWKGLTENSFLATPAMMGLAFVLSLCSTSDAFIAANIANFREAPKLAFMVFGPMMDAKLLFLYSTVFQWKFIFGLAAALFILCGAGSLLVEFFAPEPAPTVITPS